MTSPEAERRINMDTDVHVAQGARCRLLNHIGLLCFLQIRMSLPLKTICGMTANYYVLKARWNITRAPN